ncbi:DUF7289 family protein [Methanocella arvoryzae]|nr:hypothetical protein [Methanocella arvoryzae]
MSILKATGEINRRRELAVSEIYGAVLLLGIITTAIVLIVLLGSSIVGDAQAASKYSGTEQAFTVADSKISKARFSTSIYQEAPFELRDGTVYINGSWDDSHIMIYDYNNTTKTNKLIYNGTLGTIRCVMDHGEVGYQAGGIWEYVDNGSLMISPPDFDYNGVTLTLPIMRISGDESISATGNRKVLINVNSTNTTLIYPNDTFANPITSDHAINITIKSKYYKAWADYINLRTRADAIVDDKNSSVNVSLRTGSPIQSGPAGSGFNTIGLDTSYDAPIDLFNLHLMPENKGNDYRGSFDAKIPSGQEFRIYVDRTTGNNNKEYASITLVYNDPVNGVTEIWYTVYPHYRKEMDPIDLNMLNHELYLNYVSESPDKQVSDYPHSSIPSASWGRNMSSPWNPWNSPGSIDTDPSKTEYDDPTYRDVDIGEQKTLHDLIQHYLWLMSYQAQLQDTNPVFTTDVDNKPKWKYDDKTSWLNISFKSSNDIKYLYLTEGTLEASFAAQG